MSLDQLRVQQENERLHAALSDAIAYLRLMPIAPVTQTKIRDLTKALEPTARVDAFENAQPWAIQRFTPAGQRLELSLHEGALHFSAGVLIRQVNWPLNKMQLDALIEALIAERRNFL